MAKSKGISSMKSDDDWQVESDLRTMIECDKIYKDPKRLAKAQALAKKQMMNMASVASEGKDES